MYKDSLTETHGYVVIEDIVPHNLLDSFNSKLDRLHPVRASSNEKVYAERDAIQNLPNIAVWWSQLVIDWDEVIEINRLLLPSIQECIPNAHWYASDTVFIEPNTKWVNPHIDTPNRFLKYKEDQRLLGIQCIVPLYDLDKDNGATGLVPNSQKKNFDIDMCYKGYYNGYYNRNYIQPTIKKGSVLMYNTRLLHSSMPNPTNRTRPAILFNYLDNDIISDLKTVDNIWKSNG